MKLNDFIKELFGKFSPQLIRTILLTIALSIVNVSTIFTIGPLVEFVTNPELENVSPMTQKAIEMLQWLHLPVSLISWTLVFLVFIILTSVFEILAKRSILRAKYIFLREMMMGTYRDFFQARWEFFSKVRQGELINTFSREMSVVVDTFTNLAYFFSRLVQTAAYLIVPFYISWQLTMITGAATILIALPFLLFGKLSYRLGVLNTSTANEIYVVIQENLTLAKIVLGFGNQEKGIKELEKAYDAHTAVTIKSQILGIFVPLMYRPLVIAIIVTALVLSKYFDVPLSALTVLMLALLKGAMNVGNLISDRLTLKGFAPSYEQLKRFRQMAFDLRERGGTRKFEGFEDKITIRQVSFAYTPDHPVLKNVNLDIPKGNMVALVGKSGAGKSTLVDLILGLYEPKEGTICFDGVPLMEFNLNSYRQKVGYVPQESILFNMTIRDNLLWANDKATKADIEEACRKAYVDEFVKQFKDGYDTIVGDRGVRLSGGQKQRLALARALLRNPTLLILDEATSALDTQSELYIQKAIENISHETTIVVIAHRLSTIKKADCIYVFERGEVIESGNYQELSRIERGAFQTMVKLQELELLTK